MKSASAAAGTRGARRRDGRQTMQEVNGAIAGPPEPKSAQAGVQPEGQREVQPEEETPKRRKKKYSPVIGLIQVAGEGAVAGGERTVKGVAKGLRKFRKISERSARRRKNGALVDAPINAAIALSSALREASHAPIDVAKVVKPLTRPRKLFKGIFKSFRL